MDYMAFQTTKIICVFSPGFLVIKNLNETRSKIGYVFLSMKGFMGFNDDPHSPPY